MDGKRDILHCISKGSVSMKEFCYTIKNAVGVHARPAGALARMAEKYDEKEIREAQHAGWTGNVTSCIVYQKEVSA